jgi:acetyltransferase-like isoleucine patch superfamily enzyme
MSDSTPRRLLSALGANLKLRRCASVGQSTTVRGSVWVRGEGKVHVGERVVLDARAAPIELHAHKGAEIHLGPGVEIEGGASLEALTRITIGAGAKLGAYSKIMDNHFHSLVEEERHGRRPGSRPVSVGEWAEVGARAILLPGAWVGSGAVVPPGAVVSRRFGSAAGLAPVPAGGGPQEGPATEGDGPDAPVHSLLGKLRRAGESLLGVWYLRDCERAGRVFASGSVLVENAGSIRIGDRVVLVGGMIPTRITCRRGGSMEIGSGTIFNYGVTLDARQSIRIGSRCMFGSLVRISDQGTGNAGPVVIGDDVWIAHGATVEPGVTIGAGSVVSAGSTVSSHVPPGSLAIGNPARCMSLSLRSKEPHLTEAAMRPQTEGRG